MKKKHTTLNDLLREEFSVLGSKEIFEEEYLKLSLALQIARLRKRKKLTQKQFAELMGTSQAAVSRIENGNYEGFTLKTLQKIAYATGTELEIHFSPKKLRKAS